MSNTSSVLITAMSTVATVKVTSYVNRVMIGCVYNAHYDKTVYFSDGLELLVAMENLFDSLSFPGRFEDYRHFSINANSNSRKWTKERETLSDKQKDEQATFIIHVQFRQNATWQGTIQWVDQDKRQSFRSALEMIRLIDEAMEGNSGEYKLTWD